MAKLQGTILASKIVPTDSLDTYATHDEEYGRGGHRSVVDEVARDAIPADRRAEGMSVFVRTDGKEYRLVGGITNLNWVEIAGGISTDEIDALLDLKVDKEIGKQLTDQNFSIGEKEKLANITDYFKGLFSNSVERDTAVTNPIIGNYVIQPNTIGSGNTIWIYDGSDWVDTGTESLGDMLKSTYDPTNKNADVYLMDNMSEGLNTKVMTSLERVKLAGIEEGAEVNTVSAVNNKVGNVIITKSDVGLDLVDNTPDVEKTVARAGVLTNARKINSIDFDGSQDIVIPLKTINGVDINGEGNIELVAELPEIVELFTGSASIAVGGVKAGDTWDNLPLRDVVNSIINPELFPTLTAPSLNFNSAQSGLREVGSVLDVVLNASFNRGSISPKYTADSSYRAGLPISYTYTGAGSDEVVDSSSLNDSKTIVGFTVPVGVTTFNCSVSYDSGVQPKSSKGNDYSSPLSPGVSEVKSTSINGVYATYAGITLVKQPLQAHGGTITVTAPADMDVGGERFKIQYPSIWSPKTPVVQQENELSKAWDAQSMSEYSITSLLVGGVSYKQVAYTGDGIGTRRLRLVF